MSSFFVLLTGFTLWLAVFIPAFYPGRLILFADALRHFIYTNYFLNNLSRGVFPMWDPFHAWGRPDDFAVRTIGEFNPFLNLIPLLDHLGLSFSPAYFIFR